MNIQVSYFKLMICIGVSLFCWFCSPLIEAPAQGWHIFSIFIGVIFSFIIKPFPMGLSVLLGLVTLTATQTITIDESLSGFGNNTVWLVVAAFLIAGGVINTGIGKRIAYKLVSWFGKTTLGLAYSICGAELILGPIVPSNTARGGGILAPIVNSLSISLGSSSVKNPEKAGRFLTLVGAHSNLITAAMFLTGMAANPLISEAVESIYGISFGWGTWALGAIVPGLIALALLPLVLFNLAKPTLFNTQSAQQKANDELHKMGTKLKKNEWVMIGVLIMLLVLWSTKFIHGMSTTLVAWIGVCILLISNTQTWSDIIKNSKAWDTLIWLGGLLTMANMLKKYEFIDWVVLNLQDWVSGYNGIMTLLILALIYFYSMYLFSMLTAHISAMAATFLAIVFAANGQPLLSAGIFAYFSCLSGCLTNYSTGPVVIYFGLDYVPASKWFSTGFILSIFHLIIWLGVGMVWWKIIGWW